VERVAQYVVGLLGALALLAALWLPPASARASRFRLERLAYCGETAADWLASGRPLRAGFAVANGLGIIGSHGAVE